MFLLINPALNYADDCVEAKKIATSILQKENQLDQEASLRKLLNNYSKCGAVYTALGKFYYNKKLWIDSYTHYRKALEFYPESMGIRKRLGEIGEKRTVFVENPEELQIASNDIKKETRGLQKNVRKLPPLAMRITFESGSEKVLPQGEKLLDEFAKMAKGDYAVFKFKIQGHTDNEGSQNYNIDLSRKRARSVKDYLVSVRNINPEQFIIEAYGEDKPIATNYTEEGRSYNRRVQFEGYRD